MPLLPPHPETFGVHLDDGSWIQLGYRETLGMTYLVHGEFEAAELAFLESKTIRGSAAIDVGANVGIFTLPLARRVGPAGTVIAVEPSPTTAARLRQHLQSNRIDWVQVSQFAAGDEEGEADFFLHEDPAFDTLNGFRESEGATLSTVRIEVRRLDSIWKDAGSPRVTALKIDVEGAEFAVLRGADDMLARTRPAVLLESSDADNIAAITGWFEERSYRRLQPARFLRWNYAFIPAEANDG